MVQRGLRASLQTKSFVTGQQMIMLDFEEAKPPVYAKIEPNLLEIPTTQSPNENLVETFKELPVREIVIEGRQMLGNINKLMVDAKGQPGPLPLLLLQVANLSKVIEAKVPLISTELAATTQEARTTLLSAREALNSFSQTTTQIGRKVDTVTQSFEGSTKDFGLLSARVQQSMGAFDQAMGAFGQALSKVEGTFGRVEASLATLDQGIGSAQKTLGRIEDVLADDAPLAHGLAKSLQEVSAAAKSLRHTVDAIQRQPNALIFGNKND